MAVVGAPYLFLWKVAVQERGKDPENHLCLTKAVEKCQGYSEYSLQHLHSSKSRSIIHLARFLPLPDTQVSILASTNPLSQFCPQRHF